MPGKTCAADATGINTCSNGVCINRSWAAWPMPNPAAPDLPNPFNYNIDEQNAVVTDNVTKLMWQRIVDSVLYTWAEAKCYCADLDYGGHTDWRLPTRIELVSLVDFNKAAPGPTIDTDAFPDTPAKFFWTSSPRVVTPSSAWSVDFKDGASWSAGFVVTAQVRCVR